MENSCSLNNYYYICIINHWATPSIKTKFMFFKILEFAEAHKDGFTVELESLSVVTTGIAVAYAETQNSHDADGLKFCIEHALRHDRIIGGWFDTEDKVFYYDSVKIFPDEKLDEAIEFGKQNGQLAIFWLTMQQEIRL